MLSILSPGTQRYRRNSPFFYETDQPWQTSARQSEQERFKSLLWELSTGERMFESKMKSAQELRDRKKRERKAAEQQHTLKKEDVAGNGQSEHEAEGHGDSGGVRWWEDEQVPPEWAPIGETLSPSEEEQRKIQQKALLELGLAVAWNGDSTPAPVLPGDREEQEKGEEKRSSQVPVMMGLKLLPVDALSGALDYNIWPPPSGLDLHTN